MADGYLESKLEEYEKRKAAWLKKQKGSLHNAKTGKLKK
jgi:hypothetical protein